MKTNSVPKIRFKGFTDDWEQRKFGELYEKVSRKNDMTYGTEQIISVANMYYKVDVNVKKQDYLKTYNIFELGDIAFEGNKSKHFAHGRFVENTIGNGIVSHVFDVFKPIMDFDLSFWKYYINYEGVMGPILTRVTKASTMMTNLVAKDFLNENILVPSITEQQKIGEYFSNLDRLITLHQRKCDQTKELKKFMLQKMFPKKGEKNPEIRFSGFTDDWEQRKFGEVVTIERGGSPRPIDKFITKDVNGLNWVKIGDAPEQGNYITKTAEKIKPEGLSKTREVHPGDLILSNSMSFGKPYIMAIDGCIHDGWLAIRDTKKIFELRFLCTLLGTGNMLNQYKAMAAGSTVNNLNKELVGGTTVLYPTIEEQTKIGEYFSNLDRLITLHQRKCEQLKELKKFMLQNMFPKKG